MLRGIINKFSPIHTSKNLRTSIVKRPKFSYVLYCNFLELYFQPKVINMKSKGKRLLMFFSIKTRSTFYEQIAKCRDTVLLPAFVFVLQKCVEVWYEYVLKKHLHK
jgi:hypothetical protein